MEIIGYLAAILIGVSLGLIGGGGSILTVPVLVYFFGVDAILATTYSLFIVGATSAVGAYRNYQMGQVDIKTALLFGSSSIITVLLTRKLIVPAIPAELFTLGGLQITKALLTMVLFAILMFFAALSMIRSSGGANGTRHAENRKEWVMVATLLAYGVGIGLVTGLLGAGGGFLLIPALVLLVNMPMKQAVGTSLFIIALNSLIGFAGDLGRVAFDWKLLGTLTLIAIAGVVVGSRLSKYIDGAKLKKGFGWFVLIISVYILIKELLLQ
jgi:uncharacterized protein